MQCRRRRSAGVCALALPLLVALILPLPPAGAASPSLLRWRSPGLVVSGTSFHVASIDPCPAPLTQGDTILAGIFLAYSGGGGSGTVLTAAADGSWQGDVTFSFAGVGRRATLSANCQDFNGVTGVPYASYRQRTVLLSS